MSNLILDAENWHKSKLVRKYISVVEKEVQSGNTAFLPKGDSDRWLKWARGQADRLDPLTVSPPSILDEIIGEREKGPRNQYY